MATFTVTRTSRKLRRCTSHGCRIKPGAKYLSHATPPGGELGAEGWWRINECADCAARYGRPIDGALTHEQARRDHRELTQVAPNTWTGPTQHDDWACPCAPVAVA